jgi:hypothetical protein
VKRLNLTQLQAEINKDIDDTLSNSDLLGWINRALDDLTPYAKHKQMASIPLLVGEKNYTLPSDLIEIVHVFHETINQELPLLPMDDRNNFGFKKWGSTFILQPTPQEEGSISLYYHSRLPHLANPNDEPKIPSEYHDLIVLYAVAKAKYQDEEESMQQNAMQEYYSRREQFITFMQTGEVYMIQDVYW